MKKIIITIIPIIILLINIGCCKKEKIPTLDELVPRTHNGAGSIGFKLNGNIFTHFDKFGILEASSVFYISSIFQEPRRDLWLQIYNFPRKVGKYNLTSGMSTIPNTTTANINFIDSVDYFGTIFNQNHDYSSNDSVGGYIEITNYVEGDFAAGNIEVQLQNVKGKIITLTEGRFDIKLDQ